MKWTRFWPLLWALIFSPGFLPAQVSWIPHHPPQSSVPSNAVVAEEDHGVKLYVCRARLADGVHPGESTGAVCVIPYKGETQVFQDFEFAADRHYSWSRDQWNDGVIAGRQHEKSDLYVCRARVVQDSASDSFIPGKAYRFGPHTNHCYVPYQGKELDFYEDFELLHSSSINR